MLKVLNLVAFESDPNFFLISLMHESNCQTEQLNILKTIKYLHDYLLHKLALKKAAIILHIVRTNYIQDEHIPLVCTVAKNRHCLD